MHTLFVSLASLWVFLYISGTAFTVYNFWKLRDYVRLGMVKINVHPLGLILFVIAVAYLIKEVA